jgi:hypothetical protein
MAATDCADCAKLRARVAELEGALGECKLYWLIERGSPAEYLQNEHYGSVDWTTDAAKAMKFPTEHLAREIIRLTILRVEYDLRVCQHMFGCGISPPSGPQGEGKP